VRPAQGSPKLGRERRGDAMGTEGSGASTTERAREEARESEVRSGKGAVIDGERRGLFIWTGGGPPGRGTR
jgi:hypothetical protein